MHGSPCGAIQAGGRALNHVAANDLALYVHDELDDGLARPAPFPFLDRVLNVILECLKAPDGPGRHVNGIDR
jgi:hypothetical protein